MKKLNPGNPEKTLLTRVAFCPKCYANKMPQKGQMFLTIGRGRQKYFIHVVARNTPMGFTPHIVEKIQSHNGHVTFHSYCGMDGCDVILTPNESTGRIDISVVNEVTKVLTTKEWNAMVSYTSDNDYFLD